ncbi:MAG: hypothetical protein RLY20_925 [Verrucomicrobiota bacterium]|jgi:hypothetical protein
MMAAVVSHLITFAALGSRMNTIVGWIMFSIVALVALFFLLFLVVCLWEKQQLGGRLELMKPPFPVGLVRYWAKTCEVAVQLGFIRLGDYSLRKETGTARGLVSLFLSADGMILASVSGTSTIGAKLNKTILRTRLADGRVIESADQAVLRDVTRVIQNGVLLNAGIEELMRFHCERIRNAGAAVVPFQPDTALADNDQIELARGQRLVAAGMARWVNPEQNCLRLNLRGAFAHLADLISNTSKLGDQSWRVDIKRAG